MKRGIKLVAIIVLFILTIQFVSAACTVEDDYTISIIDPLGQVVTDNQGDYTCDSTIDYLSSGTGENCPSTSQCLINFPLPDSCEMAGTYVLRCTGSTLCPEDMSIDPACTEDDCQLCCEADTTYTWIEGISECCGNDADEEVSYSLFSSAPGCCNDATSCYFDSMAQAECKADGFYFKDILCDQGSWTSKTSLIAAQLIEEAESKSPGDYTLFCGTWQDALNIYNYILPSGNNVFDYLDSQDCGDNETGASCVNNICVLSNSDNTLSAFGASMNDGMDLDMLEDFIGHNAICSTNEDGDFRDCKVLLFGEDKLWYNHKYRMFIYGTDDGNAINLQTFDLKDSRATKLENVFAGKMDLAYSQQDEFISYVRDHSKKFDSIYVSKKGSKEVWARKEGDTQENLIVITYSGFTSDVCGEIDKIDDTVCEDDGLTDIIVKTRFSIGESNLINDYWTQLTAGLRIE